MNYKKLVDEKYVGEMWKKMVEDDKLREFTMGTMFALLRSYRIRQFKKLLTVTTGALITSMLFDKAHENKPYNIDYNTTRRWISTATYTEDE